MPKSVLSNLLLVTASTVAALTACLAWRWQIQCCCDNPKHVMVWIGEGFRASCSFSQNCDVSCGIRGTTTGLSEDFHQQSSFFSQLILDTPPKHRLATKASFTCFPSCYIDDVSTKKDKIHCRIHCRCVWFLSQLKPS